MDSTRTTREKHIKKQKVIFKKIRSKYILSQIFDILQKRRKLEIIKYNKRIKKRINISIKDYKEYLEIYSPIEIEILPICNQVGEFINVKKQEEIYFHIYFNDDKEEIKRNFLNAHDKVQKIKIIIDYQVKSFNGLFFSCQCIESIIFKKFHRNNIDDMSFIFSKCYSLKEINFSNFNTDNVTDMRSMFYECPSLKELNISNFNTSNVINMRSMFEECSSLKELNLSNFNTKNVTDMNCMFFNCISLQEINVSNFNTINVINMGFMFSRCYQLKDLNLSSFNTNNVIDMIYMFYKCSYELEMKIRAKYKNIKREAFSS